MYKYTNGITDAAAKAPDIYGAADSLSDGYCHHVSENIQTVKPLFYRQHPWLTLFIHGKMRVAASEKHFKTFLNTGADVPPAVCV